MKITYIEHTPNGQVVSCGSTYVDSIALIVPRATGNVITEVDVRCDPAEVYWDGAVIAKGAPPSIYHIFDYATKTWIDPRTMQSRIDRVQAQIKVERDKRKAGGTLIDGKWFHSDEPSRIQQIGLVMMGAGVPAVQWKTMDGSFVAMTQTLANAIFTATATLDMALFANAESHLAAVALATDPDVYDYSTGWPAHFVA